MDSVPGVVTLPDRDIHVTALDDSDADRFMIYCGTVGIIATREQLSQLDSRLRSLFAAANATPTPRHAKP